METTFPSAQAEQPLKREWPLCTGPMVSYTNSQSQKQLTLLTLLDKRYASLSDKGLDLIPMTRSSNLTLIKRQ